MVDAIRALTYGQRSGFAGVTRNDLQFQIAFVYRAHPTGVPHLPLQPTLISQDHHSRRAVHVRLRFCVRIRTLPGRCVDRPPASHISAPTQSTSLVILLVPSDLQVIDGTATMSEKYSGFNKQP
jgi:hypothetical protein